MKKTNSSLDNILSVAEEERYNLKHPYVGSEHLFLALLKIDSSISIYLKKYGVTYQNFKKELIKVIGNATKTFSENLYTPLLRKIINRTKTVNQDITDIYENVFISLLDEGEGIAIRILLRMNVDLDEIYIEFKEKEKLNKLEESNKIGILLNKSINLNERVICREQEIENIILCLTRKKKCNPLLIGPAGVGKTAIVEELVRRIEKNKVPNSLIGYKVYMIEMGSLISGTRYRGEFEEKLNKIIKELVNNKKSIIFIDEIHSMVSAGGAEGAINASDILKPYLARGDIKCIGATTNLEYNNTFLKDKALVRRFSVIDIAEPSKNDMIELLSKTKKEYENYHEIKIPQKVLNSIIDLSDYYLKSIVNPDKSIDLLDSSCSYAKLNNKTILTKDDVINTIINKTNNILIKKEEFALKLSCNLNKYFSKNILNKIISAFKLTINKPVSFLLNDNKIKDIIKEELNDINTIIIDLNIINGSLFIDKNINETVFNKLIEKPYSLIIFNNIENANRLTTDEIIKINTDGFISLKNNEKIYFNNAVIIGLINANTCTTGFNKVNKDLFINKSLIDSFIVDLRNIPLKELTSI